MKSDSIGNLAKALAAAQGEMGAAAMTATNPFLKNKYADLGEVIKASKPALAKHGLAVSQPVTNTQNGIAVTTILMHESGEWLESTVELAMTEERGKSTAQVAGSIITYLRRYSLAAMIGIYSDEDTDGNESKPANGKPAAQVHPPIEPPVINRQPADTKQMTRAEAESIINSKGERYGDLESAVLENMVHGLNKGLKKEGLSLTDKETYQRKLQAIEIILQARDAEENAAFMEMNVGE